MRHWIFAGIFSLIVLSTVGVVAAQVELEGIQAEHQFGEFIRFQAEVNTQDPIQSINLFIQPEGQVDTISSPALVPEAGIVRYQIDPIQEKIRTFSTLEYWFETTLENGSVLATPKQTHYYDDNRFTWQARSKSPFQAFWHEGETEFGQSILDTAQQGLEQIRNLLSVPDPESVKIYAYANAVDMGATLQLAERNWVGAAYRSRSGSDGSFSTIRTGTAPGDGKANPARADARPALSKNWPIVCQLACLAQRRIGLTGRDLSQFRLSWYC